MRKDLPKWLRNGPVSVRSVLSEELLTREEYIRSIFSRYLVTVINSVAVTGSLQV